MHLDVNRSLLIVSPEVLRRLARWAGGRPGDDPDDPTRPWLDAGIVVRDPGGVARLHPIVADVVEVAIDGVRDVVVERFDGEHLAVTNVSVGRNGRVTFTDATDDGRLTITVADVGGLPGMLEQALAIPSTTRADSDGRRTIVTSAGAIDDALAGIDAASSADDVPFVEDGDDDVRAAAEVMSSVERSWRVSAGWRGEPVDAALTAIRTTDAGSWVVDHGADDVAARTGRVEPVEPNRSTDVTLIPVDAVELMERLGAVVSGRRVAAPAVA